jgi:signal transduction histidine kinase
MQYRWITEFSAAERDRMRADLQSRLGLLSSNLNDEVTNACSDLFPDSAQIEKLGREKAYIARYENWLAGRPTAPGSIIFRRIALAIPHVDAEPNPEITLEFLNLQTGTFQKGPWPAEWAAMHNRLDQVLLRIADGRPAVDRPGEPPPEPLIDLRTSTLFEFPRFGQAEGGTFREQEWVLVELDESYVRNVLLPPLIERYLDDAGSKGSDYETEITLYSNPSAVIQATASGASIENSPDAWVGLLSPQPHMPAPRAPPPRDRSQTEGRADSPHDREHNRRPPPPPRDGFGPPGGGFGPPDADHRPGHEPPPRRRQPEPRPLNPPPSREVLRKSDAHSQDLGPPRSRPPRWRLYVRHRAGSLEAIAGRARNRNILISGGLLVMILAIVAWLFRLSRQSQRLAESHMNFVAGVSHELRTPLTVIRTAAYNLRGRVAARPDQVERYGKLIQEESEKLGALVEQVLQFASGEAGHLIRERERVAIGDVIEESLQSNIEAIATQGIHIEKHIDPDLPFVLADRRALKHALQNLIENAIKYGKASSHWIGVFASATSTSKGRAVEIRIADHGPGIPAEEQPHIFDAFFRGHRAVADQVHGTGLGLNLVRQIVQAHGATIEVTNGAASGAEFVVRIPAAPAVESINGVNV